MREPALSVERGLDDYFRAETTLLEQRSLADVQSLDDWKARRAEYRRQLQEMLGLWPLPERTPLNPVTTGTLEQAEFTVEKLHFQALPSLYVTANLYRPRHASSPAPGILYVCGHSRVVTNGISCGAKAAYQHHGAWFARNGYVCLIIDTVQLGEIQGRHRGTAREGQWWWNARGYTPAGVEAWFGIRALDYLCTRPDVDANRLGMTGRSGGGSYTWTVAALDDRVRVAAPIAGITDLRNQVVDGAVEGHCDCMFFVNTYRWDFPMVAALLAPRPLLIGNSDNDRLFPLDGVVRLYYQTRRVYELYGATNQLGLLITDGPHADTQSLQLPVFRWFNRHLKGQDPLIETAAKSFAAATQLRVFDQLPAGAVNPQIQGSFVPPFPRSAPTNGPGRAEASPASLPDDATLRLLRQKVFAGWPPEGEGGSALTATAAPARVAFAQPGVGAASAVRLSEVKTNGLRLTTYRVITQPEVELRLFLLEASSVRKPAGVTLTILDAQTWTNSPANGLWWPGLTGAAVAGLRGPMQTERGAVAFFTPRGIEPSAWSANPKQAAQIRRRFMLLGQTLDGMRVWDIRCAAQALRSLPQFKARPICVRAQGPMGVNAAYAALFEPGVARLDLRQLPRSHVEGPDYLNVLRVLDIPQALAMLGERVHLE